MPGRTQKALLVESCTQHLPRGQVRCKKPAVGLAWMPAKKQKGGGGGLAELSGHPTRLWLFSLSLVFRGFKQK